MRQHWLLAFVFAAVLLLYYPVFDVYFSQDDFFHFQASRTNGSLKEFVNLFGFPSFEERGYAFYRPLFREGLYNLYYSIFGLNHIPFRILSFLLHLINISLVYIFIQKLFSNRFLSFFTSFFFGISAANVAVLYYLAGGIQVLGATLFILLSTISFWEYLNKGDAKLKFLSFFTFILALASHELASILPFLLAGLIVIRYKWGKTFYVGFKELWPFGLVFVAYLYLDVFQIGFRQEEEQYQIVLSLKKLLNSFVWYWVWALGLPEMLVDFVRPGLSLNPSLMRYFGGYFIIIFSAFFGAVILLSIFIGYLAVRVKRFFSDKRFWFFALWFPIGILPVVFLPLHKSSYYLAPVLPAFWGALGLVVISVYKSLSKRHRKIATALVGIFVLLLVLLSATSIRLGDRTYPAAVRGRLAGKLLDQVKSQYPQLPSRSVIYFKNDPDYPFVTEEWGGTSKQAAFILNREDAIQLLYKDQTIHVFYQDLDIIPEHIPKDTIYEIVARLNY